MNKAFDQDSDLSNSYNASQIKKVLMQANTLTIGRSFILDKLFLDTQIVD